jgi:hypothetical protein
VCGEVAKPWPPDWALLAFVPEAPFTADEKARLSPGGE